MKTLKSLGRGTSGFVRDHPQRACLWGDLEGNPVELEVIQLVGRRIAHRFRFAFERWRATFLHANPAWTQTQLIRSLTLAMDGQPGGECQADRIRDAIRYAIEAALLDAGIAIDGRARIARISPE